MDRRALALALVGLAIAVAMGSCTADISTDGIDFGCTTSADCAPDYECISGKCAIPDAGTDSGIPDAGGVPDAGCTPGTCYSLSSTTQTFIDACILGGVTSYLANADDEATALLPMPFAFQFFGEDVSQFWLSSNGTLSFNDTPSAGFGFGCLPAGSSSRPAIWPFREDLVTGPRAYASRSPGRLRAKSWSRPGSRQPASTPEGL